MAKVKQIEVQEELVEENGQPRVVDAAHKTFLAGVGVVATAQDEAVEWFDKFVERGEKVEKEGRETLSKLRERREKESKKAEKEMDQRVEEILHRMNMPTKGDINALNAKIVTLTKKVDELSKVQA